jgi:hypothetical protein
MHQEWIQQRDTILVLPFTSKCNKNFYKQFTTNCHTATFLFLVFFIPFNQQELTAPACTSMYQHAPGVDQPVQQSTNINIIVPPPLHQFLLQVVDDCLILSTGIY